MKCPANPPTADEARGSVREATDLQLRKLLKAACAERDKLAKRLTLARARSKEDREAIAAMIEDEARLFKSTAPRLIVPGYDPAAAHLVGLELEHLARKVRHGDSYPCPQVEAVGYSLHDT